MQRFLRRVAVIGGTRIPFCRSNTFYADLSNLEMMTGVLNALVDRYNLKGQHIDEVVGGAVVTHSKDFNLTREAVLDTRLAASTPGITIMQACGTSLRTRQRGEDCGRRDRLRHCGRLRYDLGRAHRRVEKAGAAPDQGRATEDDARQAQGIPGHLAG